MQTKNAFLCLMLSAGLYVTLSGTSTTSTVSTSTTWPTPFGPGPGTPTIPSQIQTGFNILNVSMVGFLARPIVGLEGGEWAGVELAEEIIEPWAISQIPGACNDPTVCTALSAPFNKILSFLSSPAGQPFNDILLTQGFVEAPIATLVFTAGFYLYQAITTGNWNVGDFIESMFGLYNPSPPSLTQVEQAILQEIQTQSFIQNPTVSFFTTFLSTPTATQATPGPFALYQPITPSQTATNGLNLIFAQQVANCLYQYTADNGTNLMGCQQVFREWISLNNPNVAEWLFDPTYNTGYDENDQGDWGLGGSCSILFGEDTPPGIDSSILQACFSQVNAIWGGIAALEIVIQDYLTTTTTSYVPWQTWQMQSPFQYNDIPGNPVDSIFNRTQGAACACPPMSTYTSSSDWALQSNGICMSQCIMSSLIADVTTLISGQSSFTPDNGISLSNILTSTLSQQISLLAAPPGLFNYLTSPIGVFVTMPTPPISDLQVIPILGGHPMRILSLTSFYTGENNNPYNVGDTFINLIQSLAQIAALLETQAQAYSGSPGNASAAIANLISPTGPCSLACHPEYTLPPWPDFYSLGWPYYNLNDFYGYSIPLQDGNNTLSNLLNNAFQCSVCLFNNAQSDFANARMVKGLDNFITTTIQPTINNQLTQAAPTVPILSTYTPTTSGLSTNVLQQNIVQAYTPTQPLFETLITVIAESAIKNGVIANLWDIVYRYLYGLPECYGTIGSPPIWGGAWGESNHRAAIAAHVLKSADKCKGILQPCTLRTQRCKY